MSLSSQAQGENKNLIVKYKQYESFDLGNLEIEGKVIAPGDISVKERQRKKFYRDLYVREDFNPEIFKDIDNLR
jgi:hypothetical protein